MHRTYCLVFAFQYKTIVQRLGFLLYKDSASKLLIYLRRKRRGFRPMITRMKKFSWILLLSAIAIPSFSLPGWTQTETEASEQGEDIIDLQTMTCREMLKSEYEDRANTLIFMHGYLSGKKGETTVNASVLADVTDRILDTCIDNPEETLLSVFEESRQ